MPLGGCPDRVAQSHRTVIARLVRSVDFERVLRTRSRASSAHFAVHHVADRPSTRSKPASQGSSKELSTDEPYVSAAPVDDSPPLPPVSAPEAVWLGAVVPKRHARRSVTRTLLKRQIRAAVSDHAKALASGLWVIRLRAPFDRKRFVSAASDELKGAARAELAQLLSSAAHRAGTR